MKVEFGEYAVDLTRGIDISRPVRFDQPGPAAFEAPPARAYPFAELDVSKGAGCNCPVFEFSAHLHGTHTECVGHISRHPVTLHDLSPPPPLLLARLVTVNPRESKERYLPPMGPGDKVVTAEALQHLSPDAPALIIRTYAHPARAFLSNQAMEFVVDLGVEHLLLDLQSVDRAEDEGKLSNHHIFWGLEQGSHEVTTPSSKTITELIQVPPHLEDGLYALALNIGNIRSDAAPSKPVLYPLG